MGENVNGEQKSSQCDRTEDLAPASLAFPSGLPVGCHDAAGCAFGLTKRELFAAMAMQGAMHALAIEADGFEDDEPVDPHPIARDAVRMADALLKELAK